MFFVKIHTTFLLVYIEMNYVLYKAAFIQIVESELIGVQCSQVTVLWRTDGESLLTCLFRTFLPSFHQNCSFNVEAN